MEDAALNPFVPGRGLLPPHLGGRDKEQQALGRMLAYLEAGRSAPRDIVLIGPRGNGKTVLLGWFEQTINARASVDVVWLTPSTIRDLDALGTTLAPPRRFRNLLPKNLSLSFGLGKLGWELGGRFHSLAQLLSARCQTRPLVLLLDEAHTLEKAIGQPLLNVSQLVGREAPFLLVLAGTPGLWAHLNTFDASFWDRCESIGVGRLSTDASADVLAKPMAPEIAFEEEALRRVVDIGGGYPFFLQLWGEVLWNQVREVGANVIDAEVVAGALSVFESRRTAFYQIRCAELNRLGAWSAAQAVAAAFSNCETLSERACRQAVAGTLPEGTDPDRAMDLVEGLRSLGYVWGPPGELQLQPGIPSLMEFVRANASDGF